MIPDTEIDDGNIASMELSRRSILKVSAAMFAAPLAVRAMPPALPKQLADVHPGHF